MDETKVTETWEKAKELADKVGYTIERKDGVFWVTRAWNSIQKYQTVEGVYGFLQGIEEYSRPQH